MLQFALGYDAWELAPRRIYNTAYFKDSSVIRAGAIRHFSDEPLRWFVCIKGAPLGLGKEMRTA